MRWKKVKIYQHVLEIRRFMCGDGRRGERGDGSICVVLMRESGLESERQRVPACICLIYHSAPVLFSGSFEAHSLSHLVRGLPAVCAHVYVYVFHEWGYTSRK